MMNLVIKLYEDKRGSFSQHGMTYSISPKYHICNRNQWIIQSGKNPEEVTFDTGIFCNENPTVTYKYYIMNAEII